MLFRFTKSVVVDCVHYNSCVNLKFMDIFNGQSWIVPTHDVEEWKFWKENWEIWPDIFRWEHGCVLMRWAAKRHGGASWFIFDGKTLIDTKADLEKDIPPTYYADGRARRGCLRWYPHDDEICMTKCEKNDSTGNTVLTWRGKTFEDVHINDVIFEGAKIFVITFRSVIVLNHDLFVLEEVPYIESYPVVMSDSLILFVKDVELVSTRLSIVYLKPRYYSMASSFDCHFSFAHSIDVKFI
jgi:hypothetical protein